MRPISSARPIPRRFDSARPIYWGMFLLILGMPTVGLGQERPCEGIAENPVYTQLLQEGAGFAKAGQNAEAIAKFEEAQSICAYDPVVTFYLARAQQLNGECSIAISLYKQAETQRAAGYVDTPLTAEKIDEKRAEAEEQCSKAKFEIECADDGVTLEVGDKSFPCPISGELDAGTITVIAQKEGHIASMFDMDLKAGQDNKVTVPGLRPEGPKTGFVRVNCPADITVVQVSSVVGTLDIPCPGELELDPGAYTVSAEGSIVRETIAIEAGRDVELYMATDTALSAAEDGTYTILGWTLTGLGIAAVGTGTALHIVARLAVEEAKDGVSHGELQPGDAEEDQDDAESLNAVAMSTVGVGGALLVTGVIFLLLDESGVAVDVDASAAGLFFSVEARF